MSISVGPNASENGLIFAYDMASQQSWKGKPTTNEFVTGLLNGQYGGDGTLQPNERDAFGGFSPVYRKTGKLRFGNIVGTDEGTLYFGNTYTFSVYMRLSPNNTDTGNYEFDIVDRQGTIRVDGEIVGLNIRNYMTNEWKRFSVTATHDNNANYHFVDIGIFSGANEFDWCCPQIELGDFPSPYIPWGDTHQTRSNTEAIIDWIGGNTVTAQSLTYADDNTFNFDGSTNWATASSFFISPDPIFSVEGVFKRTASFSSAGYWGLGGGSSGNGINAYANPSRANKIGWDLWGLTTFDTGQDYPLNEYVHVVWSKIASGFTTSTLKVYINGVEFPLSFTARNNGSDVNLVDGFTFGRISDNVASYYAPGEIPMIRIYNYAITQEQIIQNFNSVRGRFGL